MPLHLLGKKSWNVYNSDNIARVRRDKAAARDREQAEEQRLQEIDAERRLAILRGEKPPSLPTPAEEYQQETEKKYERQRDRDRGHGGERRTRKRHGEDDTDFELRVAQERTSSSMYDGRDQSKARALLPYKSSDAPLTDASGHIDLFGGPSSSIRDTRKNVEAEAEKAQRKREYEDQYTMRFSAAAGRHASASGPWYAPASGARRDTDQQQPEGTDAFGRPDPGRKDRDAARIEANDPLAIMRRGAAKVREVDKERKVALEEREKEIRRLQREERRREKGRRRLKDRDGGNSDTLDGFSLDSDRNRRRKGEDDRRTTHHERRGHRHHRMHRSPRRSRSPHGSSRSDRRPHDRDA